MKIAAFLQRESSRQVGSATEVFHHIPEEILAERIR
jgi:hypothetical protein